MNEAQNQLRAATIRPGNDVASRGAGAGAVFPAPGLVSLARSRRGS